jgi:type II secretory pathway pseudopilin PulG
MRSVKRRRGFTLIEAVVVMGSMVCVTAAVAGIMISMTQCYDVTTTRVIMDTDVATAMQKIVTDVREARQASTLDNGTRLYIVLPVQNDDGTYDRSKPDTDGVIQYYRSDSTGVIGNTGNYLWRLQNGKKEPIRKDIIGLEFEQDSNSTNTITVTISAKQNSYSDAKPTELTERVVYMRNFSND